VSKFAFPFPTPPPWAPRSWEMAPLLPKEEAAVLKLFLCHWSP
jgi:hypothetical protein